MTVVVNARRRLPHRGQSASRCRSLFIDRNEKKVMTGPHKWNSIRNLKSPAGYGSRWTDGSPSMPGCTVKSNIGYKGRITPLVQLLKEAGRAPREVTHGFIQSSELAPSVFTHKEVLDEEGMHHPRKLAFTVSNALPPNQNGHLRSARRKGGVQGDSRAKLNIQDKRAHFENVSLDPTRNETPLDITLQKYGEDMEPDPMYGLMPMDPVRQEAYQPDQLDMDTTLRDPEDQKYHMHGKIVQSKDADKPPNPVNKDYTSDKRSVSSRQMATTAVQNYLWATNRHRRMAVGTGGVRPVKAGGMRITRGL